MIRAKRAISAGKSRNSIPRKLVRGISLLLPSHRAVDQWHVRSPAFVYRRLPKSFPNHRPDQRREFSISVCGDCPTCGVFPRGFKLRAQVVEKKRVQHFQDIGHAGKVQTQSAAFLVVGHGLNHGPENVRINFGPIQFAHMQQVRARDFAEPGNFDAAGKKSPFT